jgi:hypothetical protein
MHVLREILRQKLGLGRSHRQVAASVGVSAGKVAGVFAAARALGLDIATIDAMSDAETSSTQRAIRIEAPRRPPRRAARYRRPLVRRQCSSFRAPCSTASKDPTRNTESAAPSVHCSLEPA